jgi:hypothetical protein
VHNTTQQWVSLTLHPSPAKQSTRKQRQRRQKTTPRAHTSSLPEQHQKETKQKPGTAHCYMSVADIVSAPRPTQRRGNGCDSGILTFAAAPRRLLDILSTKELPSLTKQYRPNLWDSAASLFSTNQSAGAVPRLCMYNIPVPQASTVTAHILTPGSRGARAAAPSRTRFRRPHPRNAR